MEQLHLPAATKASGSITLPGSKSISNRTLLLAALSNGTTSIGDLLASDDTARMLEALQKLGVKLEKVCETDWTVEGVNGNFPVKNTDLFLGNAGTAFRPLTAALAFSDGHCTLSGVPRMHERPIGDLVDALRQTGANIEYLENEGFPPLKISPANIDVSKPIKIRGDVSSQFLTALLMALPLAKQEATIEVVGELISKPYIEITLNLMKRFGVEVKREGWQRFVVPAESSYESPAGIFVEGDASSASYFLAAGAIAGNIMVKGLGENSIQGDIKFADALKLMGTSVEYGVNYVTAIKKISGKLKAIDLDCNHIPDAAMTLAILALFADGTTTLRNIASWRVKETDRLTAMATELRKVGAVVEEGADYIKITPPAQLISPKDGIDTYDDHRMAMCFSLVALGGVPITINDPGCVAKTFPNYFDEFKRIVTVPVIAVDGPSASGKGAVAQLVAQQLGFHYLDSGALYRIVALAAQQQKINWADAEALGALAKVLNVRFKEGEVYLNDVVISELVRTEEIARGASEVAMHPQVRAALLDLQHNFRKPPGLVADGRDMASVVFTDAKLKIFLTATVEIRAERRHEQLKAKQLKNKGLNANYEIILADLQQRDFRDSARSASPLTQTQDALLLDTSQRSIEQAVDFVLDAYKKLT